MAQISPGRGSQSFRIMVIGWALLVLLVGVVAFAFKANSGLPVGRFTYAQVSFSDVGGLREGDEVRMNSLRIGRVEHIGLGDRSALVDVRLDGHRDIYRDAHAAIDSRSGLGQKFINLDPGTPSAGALQPAVIDATHTGTSNELDTLLDVFDPRTRQGLSNFVRETGSGAAGHGEDLQNALVAAPKLLPDLGTTAQTLAAPGTALPALFETASRLNGRFSQHPEHISQLIRQFDATVQAIAVDNGTPLGETIKQMPDTLNQAGQAFRALHAPLNDTASAMEDLRDGANALGTATPDVRSVLKESRAPLHKVPTFSDSADPAVEDLTDTLSDLRPLATQVASGLDRAQTPLNVLRPYAPEISQWFTDVGTALSQGDGDKHWLRLGVLPASDNVSGTVPGVHDPLLLRDPYPAPGTARKIRKNSILGGTR